MTLTPSFLRFDALGRPCGQSHIAAGKTCQKKGAFPTRTAIAAGLTAGAIGLGAYALHSRRGSSPRPSATPPAPSAPPSLPGDRTTRRLTGITPRGLLPPAPPRKSKTQRMRENTAAAVRSAESAIAQTGREEIRRIAQIGNTMATTGEATGMAIKTGLRELRLRTEAARRKYEPGYRRPDQRRLPGSIQAQLPEGGLTPERVSVPIDPRTGQPRRRQARGFGRTDNFIPFYAPVALRGIQ